MRDPVFLNCSECSFWRLPRGVTFPPQVLWRECRRKSPVPGALLEEGLVYPLTASWPTTFPDEGCADGELRARTSEELAAARNAEKCTCGHPERKGVIHMLTGPCSRFP